MKKQVLFILLLVSISVTQAFSQFGYGVNYGINLVTTQDYYVYPSNSISINLDYSFKEGTRLVGTDFQFYNFSPQTGQLVNLVGVPLTVGPVLKGNNFDLVLGVGYFFTASYGFVNMPAQTILAHGAATRFEGRFIISEKAFFSLAYKSNIILLSNSNLIGKWSGISSFTLGFGVKF